MIGYVMSSDDAFGNGGTTPVENDQDVVWDDMDTWLSSKADPKIIATKFKSDSAEMDRLISGASPETLAGAQERDEPRPDARSH